jgi:hypothetical protein
LDRHFAALKQHHWREKLAVEHLEEAICKNASGHRFRANAGAAFPLPFVIVAQLFLVFLNLRFQLAERFLATGTRRGAGAGGMERSRGQRKIQRAGIFIRPGILGEPTVQQNQIRRITSQQFLQLSDMPLDFGFDRFLQLDVPVTDGEFHGCTCRAF